MAVSRVLLEGVAPSLDHRRLFQGAAAGLAGGLLFGAMMDSAGMMPMIAALAGASGRAAGWLLHLLLSAAFGAAFAVGVRPEGATRSVVLGAAWGVALWALAAMVIMRTWLGAPIALDTVAIQSLAGHVAYGAVLGVVYSLAPVTAPPRALAARRTARG